MVKYNSAGNQMWFNTNAPSGNYQFHYYKVKIANSGAIEVLGDYFNTNNGYGGTANEIRLYHYSSTGYSSMSNWVLGYGPYDPRPIDFILNSTGEAFIGTYCKESGDENIYVLSTKNMNSIFCKYNPTGTGNSRISAIKSDNSGNVYVAGFTDIDAGTAIDINYLILKFNSTGVQQWMQTYGGVAVGEDKAIDMVLGSGSSPDVFLTGYNTNDLGNKDIVTIKYNNSGALQSYWTQTSANWGDTDEVPVGMNIDVYNNLLISGYRGNMNAEDVVTLKYGSNPYSAVINCTGLNTYTASSGSAYQWFFNDNAINGANQQTLNATLIGNGSYYCIVTQYCCVHKSNTLSGFVGIDKLPATSTALIYPNPTIMFLLT